jgi:Planctomycete cytochrome C
MKWAIYSVVVLFLVGGVGCNNQKSVVENTPPTQQPDDKKTDDKKTTWTADTVSYTHNVKPFMAKYCVECHSGPRAKAGYHFDEFDGLMTGGKKGPAVVPGDADKSLMVRALTGMGKKMPPPMYKNQPMPDDVDMVKAWIAGGAKDDSAKGE